MGAEVKGLDRFAGKVDKFTSNAARADKTIVTGVAQTTKVVVVASASPKTLSRFANGRGATLGARYRVYDERGGAHAVLRPIPPGPWGLL